MRRAPFWRAIAKNGARWTPDYLLTAVDLRRTPTGGIDRVEPERVRQAGRGDEGGEADVEADLRVMQDAPIAKSG